MIDFVDAESGTLFVFYNLPSSRFFIFKANCIILKISSTVGKNNQTIINIALAIDPSENTDYIGAAEAQERIAKETFY